MNGILIGAILGMAFVCFAGALRSHRNWAGTAPGRRPPRAMAWFVILAQIALGLAAATLGIFFLVAQSL